MLSANLLTSIEDESIPARLMKANYYMDRDALLETHEWSFATRRFKPAQSSTAPEWGYDYAYPIPSDIMRVTMVDKNINAWGLNTDLSVRTDPVLHEIESGMILTNEGEIFCKGLRRMEDEGDYSSLFNVAFAARLAMTCCMAITQSRSQMEIVSAIYAGAIRDACSRDGMQSTPYALTSPWLNNSRLGRV